MIQSDDFLNKKPLKKDKIEHAKMIYERNKEIYKYTFESMKFLDSKLTRAMTLITFMFTIQTGFITLITTRIPSSFGKVLLILAAVTTYLLLLFALTKAMKMSKPTERLMLTTNQRDSILEMQAIGQTLQLYVNISNALVLAHERLEDRNLKHARDLTSIHNMLFSTYLIICASALSVCLLNLNPL